MIDDPRGRIDYDESGSGPTLVLVPGSCSTGGAWRPIMASWNGQYRCVTTSLLGYGGTAERRSAGNTSIALEAEMLESVVRRTGGPVHLIGHSYGGLVGLVVALRKQVPLSSLSILEAPALELLREVGDDNHYGAFREMTDRYFAAFETGDREAVAAMIDFYGGEGTYASWPQRVRDYAIDTTHVNIVDWQSARGFPLTLAALAKIDIPALVITGTASHPAPRRANQLLSEHIPNASLTIIDGAAHFMIATHVDVVAQRLAEFVRHVEAQT